MSLSLSGTAGVTYPDGSVAAVAVPAGSVVQVVQSIKTDSYFTSALTSSFGDIPGQGGSGVWSVSITPQSSSNKILVMMSMVYSCNFFGAAVKLFRNSTEIALGDSVANTFRATVGQLWNNENQISLPVSLTYLDSPATTSATVYKVQISGNANGACVGRTITQSSSTDHGVYPSVIIAMEVKG